MTTIIRPTPLPSRLPDGAGSSLQCIVDDARDSRRAAEQAGTAEQVREDLLGGEPWGQWTPASLAALWPKHQVRPLQGMYYLGPTESDPHWDACAVGVLALEAGVMDLAHADGDEAEWLPERMAEMGYSRDWLSGLIAGFDNEGAEPIGLPLVDLPAYEAGYRLGQAVAALVFGAEAAQ